MMKLSVLIPVYNVEQYLEQCVESVVQQSHACHEIILYDDVSTDNSLMVAYSLQKKHPYLIKVICGEKNGGLSFARNQLVTECSGDYIWFIDSDDYLLDGAIEAVMKAMDAYRPDIISINYRRKKKNKTAFSGISRALLTCQSEIISGCLQTARMYSWLKIVRRDFWGDARRFPEGKYFEDVATTSQLLIECTSFYHIDRALLQYRIRPESIMSKIMNANFTVHDPKLEDLVYAFDGFSAQIKSSDLARDPVIAYTLSCNLAQHFAGLVERASKNCHPMGQHLDVVRKLCEYYHKLNDMSVIPLLELPVHCLKRGEIAYFARFQRAKFLYRKIAKIDAVLA